MSPNFLSLNQRAFQLVESIRQKAADLRVAVHSCSNGGEVYDFGIDALGGLSAGLRLAEVCLSGCGSVSLTPGEIAGIGWPHVTIRTDDPVAACLFSQYAGWQISVDKFFAMGSGPMRAASGREDLFEKLNYHEQRSTVKCVGVLEGRQLPDESVFDHLSEKTGVAAADTVLLVAPTASPAGNLQVVARSVETALHKLFELGFDVTRVKSGWGTAPLSPVAADDLTGIGRTNDAILYGGSVTLWVTGDDESLSEIGPQVPADSSPSYGKPFLKIFEEAGRDFYQIDPQLFSPAELVFHNLETGRVQQFGHMEPSVLKTSFGI